MKLNDIKETLLTILLIVGIILLCGFGLFLIICEWIIKIGMAGWFTDWWIIW